MDSKSSFSGEELLHLYLDDQANLLLCDPDNLKTLLNFSLNKIEEQMDSNLEMEIVDFCIARLQDNDAMQEDKITYLKEKYNLIEREQARQQRFRHWKRFAATAAVLVVMVSAGLFAGSSTKSQAGIVQWIINLFTEDKGEQLSIHTGTVYTKDVEAKEGHLPEKVPDGFVYADYDFSSTGLEDIYTYFFTNNDQITLVIEVKEYTDSDTCNNYELEIKNNSSKTDTDANTTIYYSSNHTENSISWVNHNIIFNIYGDCDFSILEEIYSYYNTKGE